MVRCTILFKNYNSYSIAFRSFSVSSEIFVNFVCYNKCNVYSCDNLLFLYVWYVFSAHVLSIEKPLKVQETGNYFRFKLTNKHFFIWAPHYTDCLKNVFILKQTNKIKNTFWKSKSQDNRKSTFGLTTYYL